MSILFDTNILIDYEHGSEDAARPIESSDWACISRMTWFEIMAGVNRTIYIEFQAALEMLSMFKVIEIDESIALLASRIVWERNMERKANGLVAKVRAPDAIIHATAVLHSDELITRNATDFPALKFHNFNVLVRSPYKASNPPN